MPAEWHICFSPFRAVGQDPKWAHLERHRLPATLDSFLRLLFSLRCLFTSFSFFLYWFFFFFWLVFLGFLRFFFFFYFLTFFLISCSFCYFVVAFILFLYFIYTSWLIQSSFHFQGSKYTITQGIKRFLSWRRMTVAFLLGVWHVCLFALSSWTLCLPSRTVGVWPSTGLP